MWPTAEHSIEQMKLCASKRIIMYYLRYTLLRSAAFTNTRVEAERMTFCVLVTTCLLARELQSPRQLSWLIDLMVDVVAHDQASEERPTWQNKEIVRVEPLIEDQRMLNLSRAVNMLARFTRELMVLYHIESISATRLSHLFGIPVADITAEIAAGQRKLAAWLNKLCQNVRQVRPSEVILQLRQLRYSLDGKCGLRLADCAFSYVAAWLKLKTLDSRRWKLN